MTHVAAVVPTLPGRTELLARALASVHAQTRPVDELIVEMDCTGLGAAATRNRALGRTEADYVAFLDDDDEWLPQHVASLLEVAERTGADLVYPCYEATGEAPALGRGCGDGWDPEAIRSSNWIPVTHLARLSTLRRIGGFPQPGTREWPLPDAEDWGLLVRLADVGAHVEHLSEATWIWHCEGDHHTRGRG